MIPLDDDELREFHEFWDPIIYFDGRLLEAQVVLELYDYMRLMQHVPVVYSYITGGQVTAANVSARQVMQLSDNYTETILKDVVREVLHRIRSGESIEDIEKEFG